MATNRVVLVKLSEIATTAGGAVNITDADITSVVNDGSAVKTVQGDLGLLVNGITDVGGICCDYSGNTYITDPTQHVVVKVSESGKVNIIAGVLGSSGSNGTKQRVPIGSRTGPSGNTGPAMFNTPKGICCDKSGNVYVADYGNNQIRKITADGLVDVVAGNGSGTAGLVDAARDPFQAQFSGPTGICVDNSGVLYVTDAATHAIRRIGAGNDNGVVLTIAGGASGDQENCRATKIAGANAIFNTPTGIAVNAKGTIFIADSGNYAVKKIAFSQKGMADISGLTTTSMAGSWVYLHAGLGTSGNALGRTAGKAIGSPAETNTAAYKVSFASLATASCLSVDRQGNVFVVDSGSTGYRLLKLDPNGLPSVVCDFTLATTYASKLSGVAVSPAQKVFLTFTV
jgi:streptogramin lyase